MQKKSKTSKERDETYYILHNCGNFTYVHLLSEPEKRNRGPAEMAGNSLDRRKKVDGQKNVVGFRLWIRYHRLWHWDCCQRQPQFKPLNTIRRIWQ